MSEGKRPEEKAVPTGIVGAVFVLIGVASLPTADSPVFGVLAIVFGVALIWLYLLIKRRQP